MDVVASLIAVYINVAQMIVNSNIINFAIVKDNSNLVHDIKSKITPINISPNPSD